MHLYIDHFKRISQPIRALILHVSHRPPPLHFIQLALSGGDRTFSPFSLPSPFPLLLLFCCSCHFPFQPWLCRAVQCVAARRSRQQAAAWLERCLLSSSCEMKMALMAVAVTVATSSTLRSPLYLLWCCYLLCMSLLTLPSAGSVQLRAAGRTKSIKEAPCPLRQAQLLPAWLRVGQKFSSLPVPSLHVLCRLYVPALHQLRVCNSNNSNGSAQLLWQRLLLLSPSSPFSFHLSPSFFSIWPTHPATPRRLLLLLPGVFLGRETFLLYLNFPRSHLASRSLFLSLAFLAAFYLPFLLFIFF